MSDLSDNVQDDYIKEAPISSEEIKAQIEALGKASDDVATTPEDSNSNVEKTVESTPKNEEQPTEVDEVKPSKEEQAKSEKLFAGKFKSEAELEKSYEQLQSEFTRVSQERAALLRKGTQQTRYEQPVQPIQEEVQQPVEQQDPYGQVTQALDPYIKELIDQRLAPIEEERAMERVKNDLAGLFNKYPEAEEYKDQILDMGSQSEYLSVPFESIYKIIRFEDAKVEGKKEAYEKISEKKAQMPESRNTRMSESERPLEELINDRRTSLDEIRKRLPQRRDI